MEQFSGYTQNFSEFRQFLSKKVSYVNVSIHILLKLTQNIQYSFSKAEIHKRVKNKQHIKNKQNDQKKKK